MRFDRRHFIRVGAGGGMASLLSLVAQEKSDGAKLGVSFTPVPKEEDLAMLRNTGVQAVSIWTDIRMATLDWMLATKRVVESNGVEVYNFGIIDLHCDPTMVLGLPGVETKIEQYKTYLSNLGRAGVGYTTYAHMANIKIPSVPG